MRYLSMKEWGEYQHYTKRHPPWIKLHARVLDNYAFMCLHDASKAHLMLLWVLASKMGNRIPYDPAFITSKIGATTPVDVEELVLQGFMEVSQDDGKTLAPRTQDASKPLASKTETEERQRESQRQKKHPAIAGSWPGEAAEVWKSVAPIPIPRLGKALKPVVDEYGWPATKRGLEAYIELNRGKTRKVEWFVDDAVRWLEIGRMPAIDPETREPTERGRLALRVV